MKRLMRNANQEMNRAIITDGMAGELGMDEYRGGWQAYADVSGLVGSSKAKNCFGQPFSIIGVTPIDYRVRATFQNLAITTETVNFYLQRSDLSSNYVSCSRVFTTGVQQVNIYMFWGGAQRINTLVACSLTDLWLRITKNSSERWDGYYSSNGIDWTNIGGGTFAIGGQTLVPRFRYRPSSTVGTTLKGIFSKARRVL